MALQFHLLRDERILHFPELGEVQRPVGKSGVQAVQFRFKCVQIALESFQLRLLTAGGIGFPSLYPGQETLLPHVWQRDQRHIAAHFLRHPFVTDEALLAPLHLALAGATVVVEAPAVLLDVPFGGHSATAGTADGEIAELESLVPPIVTRSADRHQRPLDVIIGLFADHRHMGPLMKLSLVAKDAVVERIAEHVADGREHGRLV